MDRHHDTKETTKVFEVSRGNKNHWGSVGFIRYRGSDETQSTLSLVKESVGVLFGLVTYTQGERKREGSVFDTKPVKKK